MKYNCEIDLYLIIYFYVLIRGLLHLASPIILQRYNMAEAISGDGEAMSFIVTRLKKADSNKMQNNLNSTKGHYKI